MVINMNKLRKISLPVLLLALIVSLPAQAVNFGLIQEMYASGKLSEGDYNFKRIEAVPGDAIDLETQKARLKKVRSYRGKSNGMTFAYRKYTDKKIKKVFAVDKKICRYAANKYFQSLKQVKSQNSSHNTLSIKDLRKLRFKRCMQSEGWRKLP